MSTQTFLSDVRRQTDLQLYSLLNHSAIKNSSVGHLFEAMQYSCLNGGKRLRPALVFAAANAICDTDSLVLSQIAAAVECIHSYSLVHDDLPAMDDDDLRRGQPTCHIQYDEATAILAGDALQPLAFKALSDLPLSPEIRIALIQTLADASGAIGMVGGQHIDLLATGKKLNLQQLSQMHALKTGALIKASLLCGGIASNASQSQLDTLAKFGDHIGLAFQMKDDVLDIESSSEILGKPQGSDIEADKATFPRLLGLEETKKQLQEAYSKATSLLTELPGDIQYLHGIAEYIIQRNH